MSGAFSPLFPAGLVFPSAEQCFYWASPLLAIAFVWWLVGRTDWIMNRLFPDLEWEKSLGWLNIRAERRSKTALRWLGYVVYAMLIASLYGISWAIEGLQELDNWSDPLITADLAMRIPVLGFCLGIWLLYLGCWLMPKLRSEREEAGLKRFRAEMEEAERERETQTRSRIHSPLQKPRTNEPLVSFMQDRRSNRDQPGG